MSVPERFEGGNLIRRDPERLTTSPYAEAFIRLSEPLDLYLSVATLDLVRRASVNSMGTPDTNWVEVAVREVDGVRYILVAPTTDQNPRKVPLAVRPDSSGAWIYTADDVLIAGGIGARPDQSYKMAAHLAEDAELGWVVAVNFTAAQIEARKAQNAGGQAAAAGMTGQSNEA